MKNKTQHRLTKNYHWIFADATQLNEASRSKVLNQLKNKPNQTIVIYMTTSLEETLKRNRQRTGRALVPDDVVKRMYKSMQKPTEKEKIDITFFSNGGIM